MPAIVHVIELTQPQGHSTSGSHERYKSDERLAWESEYDCLVKFREWILNYDLSTTDELDQIEEEERQHVEEHRKQAWSDYTIPIENERAELANLIDVLLKNPNIQTSWKKLQKNLWPFPLPSGVMRCQLR